jgi:glucosamine--fructose-6-phosphate aminotransferase (isomerizing)
MNHPDGTGTGTGTGTGAGLSPFERDIAGQADALRAYANSAPPPELIALARGHYDRVILTGMGSSHYAALPIWRKLVAAGCPAWWTDSGQLLDSPQLITPASLVVASSQSGASGEVVALLEHLQGHDRGAAIIGITNDPGSPLAERADTFIPLHSGHEATVSTKSYLNTLAALDRLAALITGAPADDIWDTIKTVEAFRCPAGLAEIATALTSAHDARLAFVGFAEQAATALYAGLITKEGAKIPAEGYIGGEFRHGPLELAGPGLTAVLFAGDGSAGYSLRQLGNDLVAAGSTVLTVGELGITGAVEIPGPLGCASAQLAHGAITAQYLTVALAKAKGITPGAFSYGNKITTAL